MTPNNQSAPPPRPRAPAATDEPAAVSALDLTMFALRAAKKHIALSVLCFVVVAGVGTAAVLGIPLVFDATGKIYATQHTTITAALASGRRSDEPNSARGLNEAVFSRDNLYAIVREAKLVETWSTTRTWPLRLKDDLSELLLGPPSVADKERALVELLTKAIAVSPEDSASIRFRVQWRNREAALMLTDLVQRNFLATRSAEELSAIRGAIELLEAEQARADGLIDPAIKEVQRLVAKVREAEAKAQRANRPRPVVRSAPPTAPPAEPPPELTASLQELRTAQRSILEPWQRRNADLKFELTELRATFGPEHPRVRQQEAKLQAAAEEPAELAALKQRENELLASLVAVGSSERPSTTARAAAGRVALAASMQRPTPAAERGPEDPEVATARARLETAVNNSREISERLDAARIELATTMAGFKYRYAVVEAPELPRKPIKPNRPVLFAAVAALALLLGALAGAARELLSRRIVDSFQVRALGLEVLAEVELQVPPRHEA